jgi:drug/metabolite transporter (DMT)-like permease
MSTPLTILLIAVAIALVAGAVLTFLRGSGLPFPSLGLSALTAAVCFTVGGATGKNLRGPDVATVMGALVGVLTVAAAIISLVPGAEDAPDAPGAEQPPRVPILIATGAVVIGSVGLVVSLLTT